jgi:hypothetical protein
MIYASGYTWASTPLRFTLPRWAPLADNPNICYCPCHQSSSPESILCCGWGCGHGHASEISTFVQNYFYKRVQMRGFGLDQEELKRFKMEAR